MDKPVVRISVRNLVEFILRSGILTTGEDLLTEKQCRRAADCTEKLQGRMGSHYRAEVPLKYKTEYEDVGIQVEAELTESSQKRDSAGSMRSKGVYADVSQLEKPVEVHRAQAMCYAWIYAQEQKPEKIGVQMTYGNLDTEELKFSERNIRWKNSDCGTRIFWTGIINGSHTSLHGKKNGMRPW